MRFDVCHGRKERLKGIKSAAKRCSVTVLLCCCHLDLNHFNGSLMELLMFPPPNYHRSLFLDAGCTVKCTFLLMSWHRSWGANSTSCCVWNIETMMESATCAFKKVLAESFTRPLLGFCDRTTRPVSESICVMWCPPPRRHSSALRLLRQSDGLHLNPRGDCRPEAPEALLPT